MRISDWSSDVCSSDLRPAWFSRRCGLLPDCRALGACRGRCAAALAAWTLHRHAFLHARRTRRTRGRGRAESVTGERADARLPSPLTNPTERSSMPESAPAYGTWLLVVLNHAIFLWFAFRFFKPLSARAEERAG